jgi:hypothetical protein
MSICLDGPHPKGKLRPSRPTITITSSLPTKDHHNSYREENVTQLFLLAVTLSSSLDEFTYPKINFLHLGIKKHKK